MRTRLTADRQGGGIIDQRTGGKNTKPHSGVTLYGQTATAGRLMTVRSRLTGTPSSSSVTRAAVSRVTQHVLFSDRGTRSAGRDLFGFLVYRLVVASFSARPKKTAPATLFMIP